MAPTARARGPPPRIPRAVLGAALLAALATGQPAGSVFKSVSVWPQGPRADYTLGVSMNVSWLGDATYGEVGGGGGGGAARQCDCPRAAAGWA